MEGGLIRQCGCSCGPDSVIALTLSFRLGGGSAAALPVPRVACSGAWHVRGSGGGRRAGCLGLISRQDIPCGGDRSGRLSYLLLPWLVVSISMLI